MQTTKELLEVAQEAIHLDNKLTDSNAEEFVTRCHKDDLIQEKNIVLTRI